MEGPKERTLTLFESDKPTLEKQGLVLEDDAVELDESGHITLTVQNHGFETVFRKVFCWDIFLQRRFTSVPKTPLVMRLNPTECGNR